ncbi:MAG: glutamine--fructose-6-phosphate transaminase (isomerizing) [Candidatus Daviesbacteria bacterium]|nr:glutamine--fructose-6-phosphate transaminase (isomerizing) [Candidatus Daviesbacteria bacterium]
MCGIFGYVGPKNASEVVLEGLKRLEYRGYDSWGMAVVADQIKVNKKVGAIGDLGRSSLPKSSIGMGHTRWATHGGITENNAHPHFSTDKSFCLAQNGIVENYQTLKNKLKKEGFKFKTETDTEVIVRLIEQKFSQQPGRLQRDILIAIREAFVALKGRNTIILLTKDNRLIALRNGSPLVVGTNDGEIFFSSDTLSFAPHVKKALVVDNNQMVVSENGQIQLWDIKKGKKISAKFEKINFESSKVDKEGYEHFMLKEIHESPYVVNQVLNQDGKMYLDFVQAIREAKNIYSIAVGTAGGAASQIAFYLRTQAKIKAISLTAADCIDYFDLFSNGDLIITPSQSGESADVLEVLEEAKKKGVKIASFVNMPGSTVSRISDYKFMSNAGPEICVMSTKVYTSQIAWGYLVSKIVAGKENIGRKNLKTLSDEMEKYLNTKANHNLIKEIAKILIKKKDIFLLGKYQNLNIMKEGMIKIIEGSYLHAHGMPAGDLKHYAITLMEKGVPVIVCVSEDIAREDVLNAVSQVKARGALVIGISPKRNDSFDYYIPVPDTGETSAIMNIIPLQLLAYYMAVELGNNVDKPRNIAKSVTVK